ncbi:MAG: hypothetical protein ACHQCG_00330, partial [Solirubrobacterales bacterium]
TLPPTAAEGAVLGAPQPIFGEGVVDFVALAHSPLRPARAVPTALHESIADYAIPERFFVLDELPRNAAGKIDRHELRCHAEAELAAVQA